MDVVYDLTGAAPDVEQKFVSGKAEFFCRIARGQNHLPGKPGVFVFDVRHGMYMFF